MTTAPANFAAGSFNNYDVVSPEVIDALKQLLGPAKAFSWDAGKGSSIFGGAGSVVTVHVLQQSASPAAQVISGANGEIDYTESATQSQTTFTAVNIPLT